MELINLKKVEVVIASTFIKQVIERFNKANVKGFTAIEIAKGRGIKSGETIDEGMIPVYKNHYIFVLCDEDQARELINLIDPLIKKAGGLIILSDVQTTNHI